MIELKIKVYESFVKGTQVQSEPFPIDSNILKGKVHPKSEPAVEEYTFLKGILNNPRKIDLLYRASEHNFSAASFHQKCDNIPNTLVLVRTEFGKTIGGFTPYEWNTSGNWVNDSGRKSFLFSLDEKEKYVPQSGDYLIGCNSSYGPTFGGGHDLCICDACNTSNSSYASFP